jgi:hypothetical protein
MPGFNPDCSFRDTSKLALFISKQITGDLEADKLPGLGPVGIQGLKAIGVTTTFALLGQFLILKDNDIGTVEHCDRFFYWLRDKAAIPPKYCHAVVEAVASKMDVTFPGIYDADCYSES